VCGIQIVLVCICSELTEKGKRHAFYAVFTKKGVIALASLSKLSLGCV